MHGQKGAGQQGAIQWCGSAGIRLRKLGLPEETVLPMHNVAVFVPLVRHGSRACEILGVETMAAADVGPEPYLTLLEDCGPHCLRFLGGFDTAARTVAEIRRSTDQDLWGLQAEATPVAAIHSQARQAFLQALWGAQERQAACTMVLYPPQGSGGSESVRLCIWAAYVPEELTALDIAPMPLPTDIHLVPIQQLLDLRAMSAWNSFALRQHVSDAIGLLLQQGEDRGRRNSPSLPMAWPPLQIHARISFSLALAGQEPGGDSWLMALPESLVLKVLLL